MDELGEFSFNRADGLSEGLESFEMSSSSSCLLLGREISHLNIVVASLDHDLVERE